MNKAFEKILERFEEKLKKSEERYHRYLDDSNLSCMFDKSDIEEKRVDTIKEMLEIVQEVAEEYNGGWIACSERLPSGLDFVLYTHKDGEVDICSIEYFYDYLNKFTAWQPLPSPFREVEVNSNDD